MCFPCTNNPASSLPSMVGFPTLCCCSGSKRGDHPNEGEDLAAEDYAMKRTIQSNNRIFSFEELNIATGNFHLDNKLGQGGFGPVYKGILPDGTDVAVKKLSPGSRQGKREFMNEVNLLTTIQHRNLIKLLGCCVEGSERMLVYEYLPNKSLDTLLFDAIKGSTLDWRTRWQIIMGTARGIVYLHEDSRVRIVHRDIKASNILLDINLNPKISDFGLARLFNFEDTHISTRVAGTLGYLAPEYLMHGKLTEKADIFSFGVVVLEIVSGRKNHDAQLSPEKQRLLDLGWNLYQEQRQLELVDTRIGERVFPEEVMRVLHVALLCTQAKAELRPAMSKVVMLLAGQSEILEKPTQPPFLKMNISTEMVAIKPLALRPSSVFTKGIDSLSASSSTFVSSTSGITMAELANEISEIEPR